MSRLGWACCGYVMAVEGIDAQLQSLISGAKLNLQREIDDQDSAADQARKNAEKKIIQKKERLKESVVHRETFQKQVQNKAKIQQILGGAHGAETAEALGDWQQNQQLQSKLTEAQKSLFYEAMANNPKRGAESARAMDRLSKEPGFEKAVRSSQTAGTLQKAVISDPSSAKDAARLLKNRFMSSSKADFQTQSRFLDFGLRHAKKGQMEVIKKAGDMLGSTAQKGIGRGGQRAAMSMVQRNPNNVAGMENVDSFVNNPDVSKLPSFARTKATSLLAKADGKKDVQESFERLSGDKKFGLQTKQNKGRFFATIGSGRPSDYRAISDKLLTTLQRPDLPKRSGQVGKLLDRVGQQVQKRGAQGIDVDSALKSAKASPMPKLTLIPFSEDMDEEALAKARSQNRANVIQFANKLQRIYEQGEKKLRAAKYFEDVNALQNLRDPEGIDLSVLEPSERAFVEDRLAVAKEKLNSVRKLQRQKARELRTKRISPSKRRALAARRRVQGKQQRYFKPNVLLHGPGSGPTATATFMAATGTDGKPSLPMTPNVAQRNRPGTMGGGGALDAQVAKALADAGQGPLTPATVGKVAQSIATQVAQQVAEQVTKQLLGAGQGISEPVVAEVEPSTGVPASSENVRTDGWGVPRTLDKDLGGANRIAVKSKAIGDDMEEVSQSYSGRMLVKDPSLIRDLGEVFDSSWKDLNKAEVALLRNLGWNQQMWDTKDTVTARWPQPMVTAFASLAPIQREAVQKLGMTAHDWDKRVQAFTMGKNA